MGTMDDNNAWAAIIYNKDRPDEIISAAVFYAIGQGSRTVNSTSDPKSILLKTIATTPKYRGQRLAPIIIGAIQDMAFAADIPLLLSRLKTQIEYYKKWHGSRLALPP